MAPAAPCPRPWRPCAPNETPGSRQHWTPRATCPRRWPQRTCFRSATATDQSTTSTRPGVTEGHYAASAKDQRVAFRVPVDDHGSAVANLTRQQRTRQTVTDL